MTWLPFL
nr:unnamed protein product [Callosobruchus analis]